MKSLVQGHPMMSCMDQALQASEYSLIVYLFLMLSTVLIRMMSQLTSEENNPFFEDLNTQHDPSALCTDNPVPSVLLFLYVI